MSESGSQRSLRNVLAPLGAGVSVSVIALSVLSIPLAAASELDLSAAEIAGWIMALYGLAGLLALILVLRYRQPLLVTGNVFIMIFVASLGTQLTWPELVAASMVAGGLVLVIGALGLTDRLAIWLPAPIVFGLLAGAVLPFFMELFVALGSDPVSVGIILGTYMLAAFVIGSRVPPILPALIVGFVVAVFSGDVGLPFDEVALPIPALTAPVFSLDALLTATPVMVVLITLQANVPSVVFLRGEGYQPPEPVITGVSGAGTFVGSLLGPIGLSLSLPATALVAGPDAGERSIRHRSVYIVAGVAILIGLLAGFAAEFSRNVPQALQNAIVGLAIVGVLVNALREATRGPLILGPVFAFAVSLSGLSLFGLNTFFWALVLGLVASYLLERDKWRQLRAGEPEKHG